jgi:DNA-binding XRE family transcriptional regulator
MALDELRNAKQLTQAGMAELLNVPQSSISCIEQRTDMYLSTLRNYVQAIGGVLQIQAVFPESGAIFINRFGNYEDQPYVVVVRIEKRCLSVAGSAISPPGRHAIHARGQMVRDREGDESPSSRGTADFNDSQ